MGAKEIFATGEMVGLQGNQIRECVEEQLNCVHQNITERDRKMEVWR